MLVKWSRTREEDVSELKGQVDYYVDRHQLNHKLKKEEYIVEMVS